MARSLFAKLKKVIPVFVAIFVAVGYGSAGAESGSLELQLTREAWAIDRDAFEQQLQSAQTQIRALNEKLSAQEKNLQSDMESKVDALDAQLTRVSKERNQIFLDNEKLRQ